MFTPWTEKRSVIIEINSFDLCYTSPLLTPLFGEILTVYARCMSTTIGQSLRPDIMPNPDVIYRFKHTPRSFQECVHILKYNLFQKEKHIFDNLCE